MLRIENLKTGYYKKQILNGINLSVGKNLVYLIVGPNGAGKSTLLKSVAGFLKPWEGKIQMDGEDITSLSPAERARKGIGYFFQGGEVFKDLSVKENLEVAGMYLRPDIFKKELESIYGNFPKLKDIGNRRAGLLSGGERHQLALSMVFLRKPEFILLDEPSAGLAPGIVNDVLMTIRKLKELNSSTILLVEQNISEGLKISDYVYFMKTGQIINSAKPAKDVSLDLIEKLFFE